ncbi:tetratricopeptide (TPR) repeat protein [Aquimarina sp. EL_43]|uniref:tetratricopeptide repeat protein n=1 Tax=Aquimarina TaxID=290174 RepID=UPI0004719CDD|nr:MULTISPECIES: tetratricopeptide repeat protein [Aquimarina]MBG6130239.1 tetratricopeptide (TPR) repeat protein [Aquimarina sp. EL_35]MBG6149019.1 tetratricopeptide (TPR) repeat protein [Aquimarina sp. EL_32]MBG6168607.1 tetratricopeptide (TPR) repeat protein [Aquimarina sp. EL_43]
MSNLLDKYLFQALDAYPYNLEEAVESLNYALSYDEKNPIALSLLGQIYAESLKNYEVAKEYYQQALAEDMYALDVYPKYINVLLWNEDYEEAEKLVDFALTVKGTDKAMLYLKKGILFEQKKNYKKALKCLKLAKENAYNNHFINDIKEEEERIKNKMPKQKKAKDKSSSKKKTKKS